MTKILKPMPLGSPGGERQNRVTSIQSLDSALFIDTEDRCVGRLANAQLFSQSIAAPVSCPVGRTLTGGLQDTCLALVGTGPRLTTPITRIQSCQPLFLKALLPLPDILVAAIQAFPNFPVRMT